MTEMDGWVAFVGAGPGDDGLLTLRGARVLTRRALSSRRLRSPSGCGRAPGGRLGGRALGRRRDSQGTGAGGEGWAVGGPAASR